MVRFKEGLNAENPSRIEDLREQLQKAGYPEEDIQLLQKAYDISEEAHREQTRYSGEPYITHPVSVASILAELNLDIATVITGLLHDTVEDTKVTLDDIRKDFGSTVTQLVDGVTKISQMKFQHTHEKQGENIRKMIVSMGNDVRVILVKLADRLHNMRTMGALPIHKSKRIAQETLDIYAPLASRLGMSSIKTELEDLSFKYTEPYHYSQLAKKIKTKKEDRNIYIKEVTAVLESVMKKNSDINFEIQGRPKHLFSIYQKMNRRNLEYNQIYDILAFRICVDTIPECYEALGMIHSLWRPVPGRFKDFIAMPKANNYQSLHTTVMGPQAERIEIQIRTFEMNDVAEWGIATHWRYKDKTNRGEDINNETLDKFNWLRELVSFHQNTHSSDELLENIKSDLVESDIYVFTPKGEVKEFPRGATPIDFAYSVHTDVGERTVSAKVNGRIVPLKHLLANGDTIEIITSKTQTPSKDWLRYCVTSKAKHKIRSFVRIQQRAEALELGREILDKFCRKQGSALKKLTQSDHVEEYLKNRGLNNEDDLFVQVGYGRITPGELWKELFAEDPSVEEQSIDDLGTTKPRSERSGGSPSLISVGGVDNMMVRFGRCCNPIPGDSIIGFITRGRGVTVHRADCERAFELDQDRSIAVSWLDHDHGWRNVNIRVTCYDVAGLLKQLTETLTSFGININQAKAQTMKNKQAICDFDLNVKNSDQLADILSALQGIEGVTAAYRL